MWKIDLHGLHGKEATHLLHNRLNIIEADQLTTQDIWRS